MKIVILTATELAICDFVARERREEDRKGNITEQPLGPDNGLDNDYYGFCAEFAVAKDKNLMPDFSTNIRKGGYDLITHKGCRIDVKHTCHDNGRLIAPKFKHVDSCDYYILVKGTNPFYIIGWIESAEFIREENLQNLGYGPTYVLPNDRLKDYK